MIFSHTHTARKHTLPPSQVLDRNPSEATCRVSAYVTTPNHSSTPVRRSLVLVSVCLLGAVAAVVSQRGGRLHAPAPPAAVVSAAQPVAAAAPPGRTQHLTSPGQIPQGLSASDWGGIRAAYQATRHAVQPLTDQPGQWLAWNPGQQWRTRFDRRGFLTTPTAAPEAEASWQWGLQLQSYGFPGQERAVGPQATVTLQGSRVTYGWNGGLEEWFSNDARGLEHGFTI